MFRNMRELFFNITEEFVGGNNEFIIRINKTNPFLQSHFSDRPLLPASVYIDMINEFACLKNIIIDSIEKIKFTEAFYINEYDYLTITHKILEKNAQVSIELVFKNDTKTFAKATLQCKKP